MTAKTIVITNHKGGIGKTTITAGIGKALAEQGKKVLLIDTDSQGNLSRIFGYEPKQDNGDNTLYYCIKNKVEGSGRDSCDYIVSTGIDDIDLIIGDSNMEAAADLLKEAQKRFMKIYEYIFDDVRRSGRYDYILLDTSPRIGDETGHIFAAVDYILIPTTKDINAIEGIDQIISLSNKFLYINPDLKVAGIVLNDIDLSNPRTRDGITLVQQNYPELLFENYLPHTRYAENILYNGWKNGENNFNSGCADIAKELVERIG